MKRTIPTIVLFLISIVFLSSCKSDSKVIASFGYMNEKLEESMSVTAVKNDVFKGILERNVADDSIKYKPIYNRLNKAQKVSNEFYYYLESIKDSIYTGTLDKNDARSSFGKLVNSKYLDIHFFDGATLTSSGEEFLLKINEFKKGYEKSLGKGYGTVASMVTSRFRTKELMDYSGNIIPWLNFKFESFPAMVSIFNITQMQSDIRLIEQELINSMNSGEFAKEFAMRNYTGIVHLDKGSYYPDERITGRIVMGRFDESVTPSNIVMNGRNLSNKYATEGAILVDFKASSPGEYPLGGHFTVMYDGTPVRVNYDSSYKVISRENVIEKVVYKTEYIEKPIYIDRPVAVKTTSKPKTVTKPVVAKDAKTRKYYSKEDKTSLEIEGLVNSEKGKVTMLKTTLRQAKVSALRTQDKKTFAVTSFKIKVPGLLTVYVEGDSFTNEAIRTIDKAKTGQLVTIFDIKAVDQNGIRQGKVKEVKIDLKR